MSCRGCYVKQQVPAMGARYYRYLACICEGSALCLPGPQFFGDLLRGGGGLRQAVSGSKRAVLADL